MKRVPPSARRPRLPLLRRVPGRCGSSGAASGLAYATPASATTGSAGAKVVTRRTKLGNVLVHGGLDHLFEKHGEPPPGCAERSAAADETGAKRAPASTGSPSSTPGHRRGPPLFTRTPAISARG